MTDMTEANETMVVIDDGVNPQMVDGVSCCLTCFTYF